MHSALVTNWSITEFLQPFLDKGYQFVLLHELTAPQKQIALRHDVDFNTSFALQMAQVEHDMGVKASYFFLMRSSLYNVFSPTDYSNINAIKALGHNISIHFDPTLYTDFHAGLELERNMFRTIFDTEVSMVSLHRPNDFFLNHDEPIVGVEHTYQSKYFKQVKYFSDSTGIWRFGHPFNSEEFENGLSMHILIHPIWWLQPGFSNQDKIKSYFADVIKSLNRQFYLNGVPFSEIYDQV